MGDCYFFLIKVYFVSKVFKDNNFHKISAIKMNRITYICIVYLAIELTIYKYIEISPKVTQVPMHSVSNFYALAGDTPFSICEERKKTHFCALRFWENFFYYAVSILCFVSPYHFSFYIVFGLAIGFSVCFLGSYSAWKRR
jgi:hypothetical protein